MNVLKTFVKTIILKLIHSIEWKQMFRSSHRSFFYCLAY